MAGRSAHYMCSCQNINGVSVEGKNGMKKIDILNKVIEKALKGNYDWDIDYEDWEELSELEKITLLRALLQYDVYTALIFDRALAKALWGEEKYMAYYAGYNEWADATEPEPEYADFDERQNDRMPLFEYHLMMMARSTDRLKYLEENS